VTHLGFKDFSSFKEYKKKTFSDKKYLLFVGRRAIYKNFNALLKAYSSSEELMKNFNIIQFGGNKFSKEEIELIKSLKIDQSNIIHLNGNDKTLFDLYSNASALILPSLYEGFGLPILEAMSIGCPVVCSNTSSLPEVAGSAVKYFDPKNYEDIKEAIISVVFSSTYKNELIKLGYDQVKKFSWEKCAKDTLKIYKKFDV
jgi:glycosyltransferase involved in cell wall biosynthesis